MEGFTSAPAFAGMVGKALFNGNFTLLDVGCSSGIDPIWRTFGESLRAFGFDPNIDEIERLAASETAAGVCYIPAFVGIPPTSPDAERMRSLQFWARSPWARLSVARTLEQRAATEKLSNSEATTLNLWNRVRLANAQEPVVLPEFCADRKIQDVDFIKIDVDGPDFLILRSLAEALQDLRVLGIGIEVNFFGSDDPNVHTLHNVDRFMRRSGFDLFSLSTRPYSVAALPARYQYTVPAQTEFGRPLQGDAVYLRDAASPENAAWWVVQEPAKLLKLAALYSLAGLVDCAAEILVDFREQLTPIFDVDAGLDVLTQAVCKDSMPAQYRDYIAAFEADDQCFYQPPAGHDERTLNSMSASDGSPSQRNHVDHRSASTAQIESERLRAELRAVYKSTSWSITTPLRWLGRRTRNARSKALPAPNENADTAPVATSPPAIKPEQAQQSATPSQFEVFLSAEAQHINHARLEHVAALGLDLTRRRVLEVGAGIGLHTEFFERAGCSVLSTDGAAGNVAEIQRRWPQREIGLLDLDRPGDLAPLGRFDVVYAYGTLCHLRDPDGALRRLSAICSGVILVETIVSRGSFPELHPVADPPIVNQAVSGFGCRPTRAWVMAALRQHFGHAYTTLDQPEHPDFVTDWHVIRHQGDLRAVFVGSKQPLSLPSLTTTLPVRHRNHRTETHRRSSRVWIDVGAHRGQYSRTAAEQHPELVVHAFEPVPKLATELMHTAPSNYFVHATAVTGKDGVATLNLNKFDAASSLLPMDEATRASWVDGHLLGVERTMPVPTIRLDTFMLQHGIKQVELLKVDAQGADLAVVRSAGALLRSIHTIQLECAVTPSQLYVGAASKYDIVAYMAEKGFDLKRVETQSHGQEENLTFIRRDAAQPASNVSCGDERIIELYDLSHAVPSHGEIAYEAGQLAVVTAPQPWAYAALVPAERSGDGLGAAYIEVSLAVHVEVGSIEVGLLNREESAFLATATVDADSAWHTVTLVTRTPAQLGPLVVRNGADTGRSRSNCRVLSATVRVDVSVPENDPIASDLESAATYFEEAAKQLAIADHYGCYSASDNRRICDAVQNCRSILARGGFALTEINVQSVATLFAELDRDTLRHLVPPLAALPPLVPMPGWRFDSFLEDRNLATFLRYALWLTLRDRHPGEAVVVPWHGDTLMELHFGTDLSLAIFVAACFEPNEFALLQRVLEPGMCVIDGGANDGAYTLYTAARVGSQGRVLAVEPSPRELERLRKNLALNHLPQVEVMGCALAERCSELQMLIAEDSHAGHNTLGQFMHTEVTDRGRITVTATTIDDLVQRYGLPRIDVVKLDLEGAELRALIGASTTLDRDHPLVLLEAAETALKHQGGTRAGLRALIWNHGYDLFQFDSVTGELAAVHEDEQSSDTLIAIHPARTFGLGPE